MSMMRKTIPLTHCKDMGYITIIKVGSEVGVKLVLNGNPKLPLYLSLKVGSQKEFVAEVTEVPAEFSPSVSLFSDDIIGVIVLDTDGNVFCAGGRRELVNIKTTKEEIALLEDKKEFGEQNNNAREPELIVYNNESSDNPTDKDADGDIKLEVQADETADVKNPPASEIAPLQNANEPTVNESETTMETMDEGIAKEETIVEEQTSENGGKPFFGERGPFAPSEGENFYRSARERFEELFTVYPKEETIASLIPDSEWVKVDYEGGDFYLVGLVKEGGEVKLIGYGIPGEAKVKPPKEVANMCDFLPMPNDASKGWWLMFQNPVDGTMILN